MWRGRRIERGYFVVLYGWDGEFDAPVLLGEWNGALGFQQIDARDFSSGRQLHFDFLRTDGVSAPDPTLVHVGIGVLQLHRQEGWS